MLNEVVLNQVLVSFGAPEATRAVIGRLQAGGVCWCGGTVWQGQDGDAHQRLELGHDGGGCAAERRGDRAGGGGGGCGAVGVKGAAQGAKTVKT